MQIKYTKSGTRQATTTKHSKNCDKFLMWAENFVLTLRSCAFFKFNFGQPILCNFRTHAFTRFGFIIIFLLWIDAHLVMHSIFFNFLFDSVGWCIKRYDFTQTVTKTNVLGGALGYSYVNFCGKSVDFVCSIFFLVHEEEKKRMRLCKWDDYQFVWGNCNLGNLVLIKRTQFGNDR